MIAFQGTVTHSFAKDKATEKIAHQKIAKFCYSANIPFRAFDSEEFVDMVRTLQMVGPNYKPPNRKLLATDLLDEAFEQSEQVKKRKLNEASRTERGLTIAIDGATITKHPLTNVVAHVPGAFTPILLDMDDATDWYVVNETKDARYHFTVLQRNIEDVGPSNVAHVVTDCCSNMLSMWSILLQAYPFLFVTGCICHRLNTLLKHILSDIPSVNILVDKATMINNYFNNHHQIRSIFRKHCIDHLKADMAFIVPAVTRFGLFLLMLHRLIIFRPVLISTIADSTYLYSCQDDEVDSIVSDMTFWRGIIYLTQGLLPVLRLIRLADSDCSYIGKIYPTLQDAIAAIRQRLQSVPEGDETINLIEHHTKTMIQELH